MKLLGTILTALLAFAAATAQNDTIADKRLPSITVYGSKSITGIDKTQMSAIEVPVEHIRMTPAVFGEADIMKTLQKLPGVQQGSDGTAGIYVRGGNYDQNIITLDGALIYNTEHLGGYMSAINSDVVDGVALYKGAFLARYGGRLSSVVDIGIADGDMNAYHGSLTAGMLLSKLHASGPIVKGKNSFNIAARVSYFGFMAVPMLRSFYDDDTQLNDFADMDFFDMNAKLTHRFSDSDKLSATFYMGRDKNDTSPTATAESSSATENNWGNIVASACWDHRFNKSIAMTLNPSYSSYRYKLRQTYQAYGDQPQDPAASTSGQMASQKSDMLYRSEIEDISVAARFSAQIRERHELKWGAEFSTKASSPRWTCTAKATCPT